MVGCVVVKLSEAIPQDILDGWDKWDYHVEAPVSLDDPAEIRVVLHNEDGSRIAIVIEAARMMRGTPSVEVRNPDRTLSPVERLLGGGVYNGDSSSGSVPEDETGCSR